MRELHSACLSDSKITSVAGLAHEDVITQISAVTGGPGVAENGAGHTADARFLHGRGPLKLLSPMAFKHQARW